MRCSGDQQQQNIAFYNRCIIEFNDEQRVAFDLIAAALADNYEGTKVFKINAPGGCGKTFLLNSILAYARGMGKKCIATALSGIVALYHTICVYTLRIHTYICYMAFRTLDLRYTYSISVSCTTRNYKHCLSLVVTIATHAC